MEVNIVCVIGCQGIGGSMPPNEADQIDYMAEEGYMSDFVDDVDGDENGGGDQNIDDYDMVSLLF